MRGIRAHSCEQDMSGKVIGAMTSRADVIMRIIMVDLMVMPFLAESSQNVARTPQSNNSGGDMMKQQRKSIRYDSCSHFAMRALRNFSRFFTSASQSVKKAQVTRQSSVQNGNAPSTSSATGNHSTPDTLHPLTPAANIDGVDDAAVPATPRLASRFSA